MDQFVYKVITAAEWGIAQTAGVFQGSPVDDESGFIHFSSQGQLAETLAKHFAGQADLVSLKVDTSQLSDMKWEPSRDGALFPHLYSELPVTTVVESQAIPLNAATGIHDISKI